VPDKLLRPTPAGRRTSIHRAGGPLSFGGRPRHSRHWPKRLAIGVGSLAVVLVVLAAAVFVYARVTFDKVHKASVQGLTPQAPGKPFDILLVGSDTRAFVDNSDEAAAYGSAQSQTGQRSDVIIVARVVPATHQVKLLSIPRDTWVDIPGDVKDVSGPNKINVAYNDGPSLLVETIERTFHIPVTYYVSLDFPAFEGMVNALGGIYLDFPYPAKDPDSGLDITTTGCQLVNGAQALALVRSRHYYYYVDGAWQYDGLSDLSRIRRQDAFFTAVLQRVKSKMSLVSLPTLNGFVSAASSGLTIDQSLSEGAILDIARMFRGVGSSALQTETLPTSPYEINGEDVLLPVTGPDSQAIGQFLAFGTAGGARTTSAGGGSGTTSSTPSDPGTTTASLRAAAEPVAGAIATSASLSGARAGDVVLTVAPGVASPPPTTAPTVGTVPGTPTITNPADIDFNTQPEPWNPTACTP
jgi:LCP family protein required for cell wall assembly